MGGLIGFLHTGNNENINQVYATGMVSGGATNDAGGVYGQLHTDSSGITLTLTNNYYGSDVTNTNQANFAGTVSAFSGSTITQNFNGTIHTPITSTNSNGAITLANIMTTGSAGFAGFTFAETGQTAGTPTFAANSWLILSGQTMPMLSSEWNLNINTPHQLQLMAFALGADYTLENNINLSPGMNNVIRSLGNESGRICWCGFCAYRK